MLKIRLKHFSITTLIILVLFWPQAVNASGSPALISPPDNSTEDKSPKLVWEYQGECIQSGSCFKVEVDDSQDFQSPEKSTYTNNFSYSPQGLIEGVWNWRVKAKDKAGSWSEWSKVFRFTVSTAPAAASSSPNLISPTPQPSLPSSSSKKAESVFLLSNLPSEINSTQEFESSISLSLPNNPNQNFYLKGAFKKSDSSNYFGLTYAGDWIKNNSSYSNQLRIQTTGDGRWEGKIKVKPDPQDSGYEGTGNYVFKIARYSDPGSGPVWSNELSIKINDVETPKPTPASEKKEETAEENEPGVTDLNASIVKNPSINYGFKIASVAGEATKSDNINSGQIQIDPEEKNINWFLIILGLGILSGGAGFTFLKIKKGKLNANI